MPHTAARSVIAMPSPAAEEIRYRALERLYQRRELVDALIRSLEEYEDTTAACIPISVAVRKCS